MQKEEIFKIEFKVIKNKLNKNMTFYWKRKKRKLKQATNEKYKIQRKKKKA